MSASTSGQAMKVSFPNQFTSMAGHLFLPANMDKTKKYPALAVAHHFWWRQRADCRNLREKNGRKRVCNTGF